MPKKIAVIDGNSLMHRAYHAVPPTMNAPDGRPTNAVFGFLAMLLKFIDIAAPDAIICAFDDGKPAFRIEELAQYKAQRPPMDEELREQFPIMEELLGSLNIPVVKKKGWEGDDILGTVSARDEGLGYETLLVTGDKDACQLASELTRIVTTKKGITDVAVYGPAEVKERYGVTPEQFPDFLGLMGDSSDNIPGVPGIGPKTAASLLQRFDTMEGVYAHLDELKGKQLENLRNNEQLAYLSRKVATIVRDLDFPLDLEDAAFPSFDPAQVEETFRKYQLSSHLTRFLRLVGAKEALRESTLEIREYVEADEARALIKRALGASQTIGVALDEPSKFEQLGLFDERYIVGAFAGDEGVAVLENDEALAAFAEIVEKGRFAALDVKAALQYLYPPDSAKPALAEADALRRASAFDLSLAAYLLNSSESKYDLPVLMDAYGGGMVESPDGDKARVALDAMMVKHLVEPLRSAVEEDGSAKPYGEIDLPLVSTLAVMERTGAAIDADRLRELGKSTEGELTGLKERIYGLAGEEFNVDSPKQLAHILFEVLGLKPIKKNQRGYSTDASVLTELAKENELPQLVLHYRELAKMKSTYIDALPRMRAEDGRVHTSFNETVAATGRLSSSDPNLQNIPVRTDFGRQIRACFVPLESGEVFLSADYSQIELRLLAHLSGDERLIAAFQSGADFHTNTASHVFGVPVDAVTPEMRRRAKAVNFGIVYGQQAYGLSQSLDIPYDEAREMIERYFAAYPGVRRYLDEAVAEAKRDGYAQTMFGRKRRIPELKSRNAPLRAFGERTAMNHPMQGSAADIIKLAMNEVDRKLAATPALNAKMMLQVHDELDFSVPAERAEELAACVKEIMEGVVSLKVPLVADIAWGANWTEAH